MTDAYAFLYNGTLIVIGVLLLFCLIRAIRALPTASFPST